MSPTVNRDPRYRIPTGMHVFDRDSNGFSRMIVVNHSEAAAEGFNVSGTNKTVAEYNSDYSEDSPVVEVVYQGQLNNELPNWKSIPTSNIWEAIQDADLKTYAYPAQKMKSVTSIIPSTIETYRELFCYQNARMSHLSVTMKPDHPFAENLMWDNYEKRVAGEITASSILKENKYQMKENIGVCLYCGDESDVTFDHVVPMDKDGKHDMENMVPVCKSCNSSKSNKNVIDWHTEHNLPVDRVVLGKYIKLRWEQLESDLDDPIPESVEERWDGVEITRNISQVLTTDSRLKQ